MILKLEGEFKSLDTFTSDELVKFTVITGMNGSGKSQLLELIDLYNKKKLPKDVKFEFDPVINRIQVEGIENNNLKPQDNKIWKDEIQQYYIDFIEITKPCISILEVLFQMNVDPIDLKKKSVFEEFQFLIGGEEIAKNILLQILYDAKILSKTGNFGELPTTDKLISILLDKKLLDQFPWIHSFLKELVIISNKRLSDLEEADFYKYPVLDDSISLPIMFHHTLDKAFYSYAKKRDQNRRLYFNKISDNEDNNSVSDNDFINEFVPPWDLMNSILKENKIDFYFPGIEASSFSNDVTYRFLIKNYHSGKEINLEDLSSGEKIIIGLLTKLFSSQSTISSYPELLILDEPDAHLHPDMSKVLINVLNNSFVKELGINVIITTHSPSTVALCPEDSIYELKNINKCSLIKIDKDAALKILTGNLPTLSIDYESHKQVFVESPTDELYYRLIFNKLNEKQNFSFKLYFLSLGYGKSNCDQVKKATKDFSEAGNKKVYGIIDRDMNNKPKDNLLVHGIDQFYSIENILYNPIYIYIYIYIRFC